MVYQAEVLGLVGQLVGDGHGKIKRFGWRYVGWCSWSIPSARTLLAGSVSNRPGQKAERRARRTWTAWCHPPVLVGRTRSNRFVFINNTHAKAVSINSKEANRQKQHVCSPIFFSLSLKTKPNKNKPPDFFLCLQCLHHDIPQSSLFLPVFLFSFLFFFFLVLAKPLSIRVGFLPRCFVFTEADGMVGNAVIG